MERTVARFSGDCVIAQNAGTIEKVDSGKIVVRKNLKDISGSGSAVDIYNLVKYTRSNQNTCINQRPIVKEGDKVLIVEDVITTGKSSMECSKLISLNNANIVGYACIIDRSNGKSEITGKIVSQLKLNIPTYSKDNLPKELLSIEAVKPGSRNL